MNRIRFLLVVAAISCIPLLNRCDPNNVDQPEPKEPETVEEILAYLKSLDIYDIHEHSCTVETSTDSYEYPPHRLGYNDFITPPLDQIDTMSTLGLIETVLENPVWFSCVVHSEFWIYRFMSTSDAIYGRFEIFNPGLLDKLYEREDAASLLIERYTNMYPTCSDNNYSSLLKSAIYSPDLKVSPTSLAFMEIQSLMAEDLILCKLTKEELREVSVHIVKTYISVMETTGLEYPYYFSIYGSAWLAARIMEINEYQPFDELWGDSHFFLRTSISKFMMDNSLRNAQLMLCFNNFIHEEL